MEHIIGIGDYAVSGKRDDVIKTFALSTCVAVTLYSPDKKVFAMAHVALPDSSTEKGNASFSRTKYADTAVDYLISSMKKKWNVTGSDRIYGGLFGGIQTAGRDKFKIGERNLLVLENKLKELGIPYVAKETGGKCSRTLTAFVNSGEVEILKLPLSYCMLKDNSSDISAW